MPARRFRSRSYRRHQVRTPGGRPSQLYKSKRPGVPRCASCSRPLGGVPTVKKEVSSLPSSSKSPNRPFGGYFCSACLRKSIKEKARA